MTSNVSPRNRLERILKRRKEALEKVVALEAEKAAAVSSTEDGEEQPDQTSEKPDQT